MNKTAIRLVAVAATLGAALSANAYVLTFAGNYTGTFLTANSFDVDATLTQGLSFNFAVDDASSASATGGTASLLTTLKNFSGSKSLQITSTSNSTSVNNGGVTSFSGAWTGVTSGLGINNFGTYSGSFDGQGNYSISITGAPVPEPASMVALSLGAVGLLRRRARKA